MTRSGPPTASNAPAPSSTTTASRVTFTVVATHTGRGRTTLYRGRTVRAVIDQHRHRAATSGTLTGLTNEIAMLRTALDSIATRVRHHKEQLRRLTAEETEGVNRQTPENKAISRIMLR